MTSELDAEMPRIDACANRGGTLPEPRFTSDWMALAAVSFSVLVFCAIFSQVQLIGRRPGYRGTMCLKSSTGPKLAGRRQ